MTMTTTRISWRAVADYEATLAQSQAVLEATLAQIQADLEAALAQNQAQMEIDWCQDGRLVGVQRVGGDDCVQRGDEGGVAEDQGGHCGDAADDRRPVGGRRYLSRPREE